MHDIDRPGLVFEQESEEHGSNEWEYGAEEAEFGDGLGGESPLTEEEEIELASELLSASSNEEVDMWLGGLFNKIKKKVGGVVPSKIKGYVGGLLKGAAKKYLPIAGGALGGAIGGPFGAMIASKLTPAAARAFGLESEGLSGEDEDFEATKQFVRFAGDAIKKAALNGPAPDPQAAAKAAVIAAAQLHAPGLVRSGTSAVGPMGTRRKRSGRWTRMGSSIILHGA